MHEIMINGIKTPLPQLPGPLFSDLLSYLHQSLVSDKQLIASMKVDGRELTETLEAELSKRQISDINSLEVTTAHPREVVEETLQSLRNFVILLGRIARETSGERSELEFEKGFVRVMDGLEVLASTVSGARRILKVERLEAVDRLEAELLSELKALFDHKKAGQMEQVRHILSVRLPSNLERWHEHAIPALIRCRDS